MPAKIALLTGGTGMIGPTLVQQLQAHGYQVRVLARSMPAAGVLPEVEFIQGHINDPEAVGRAVAGVDVVFHLAALLHIENPAPDLESEYQRINVDGTREVIQQAKIAGVRRLIYFSTVKVYGVMQRNPVTETYPTHPRTIYAQTKLDGEKVSLAAEGIEVVVLRLSAVFGGRLQGSWRRLMQAIERGFFIPIGDLQNCRSLTYVEDVARAAILVADHPATPGNIYNVAGYEAVPMHTILKAIYAALNKHFPAISIPAAPLTAATWIMHKGLALIGKRSPITPDALQQLTLDETYSGAKLKTLGFVPRLPLDQAWQVTISQLENTPQ